MEEGKFAKTLKEGYREFDKIFGRVNYVDSSNPDNENTANKRGISFSGQDMFRLFDTY